MSVIEEKKERIATSRTFRIIRALYGLSDKAVLDIGCGDGHYLRLFGTGSVGVTTAKEEVNYGVQNNLPIVFGNAEQIQKVPFDKKFDAVWANNLFEHLLSPHAFLMRLKSVSKDDAVAILGVPVVPKIISLIRLPFFRGTLATNHVNFFTHTTLRLTVERAGWDIVEVRPFFSKIKFLDVLFRPFAPHIYIVATNNTSFTYPPKKLMEWVDEPYYHELLSITRQV